MDNAASILLLGYLHSSGNMKFRAMDFIKHNMNQVALTNAWKEDVVKGHPQILSEMMTWQFGAAQMSYCALPDSSSSSSSMFKQPVSNLSSATQPTFTFNAPLNLR